MNKIVLVLVAVVLAAGAAFYVLKTEPSGNGRGDRPASSGPVEAETLALQGAEDSIRDPAYGKVLFDLNCAACHGYEGRGDGSAATYLWRRPADLTDGHYLSTRSDEQLL